MKTYPGLKCDHKVDFSKEIFVCKKCKRKINTQKLTIGSAQKGFEDFVNLDILRFPKVDVIHDLNNYPWPFKDNQFKVIHASHIIEHLDVNRAMKELHRITMKGGEIRIRVPHHSSPFKRLSHLYEGFNIETFTNHFYEGTIYADVEFKQLEVKVMLFGAKAYMKAKHLKLLNWFINLKGIQKIYERFFCYIMPSAEIHYKLTPLKGKKKRVV